MIALTDADNGQLLHVEADWVVMVRVLGRTRTEVTTRSGEKIEVREAPERVLHLRRVALTGGADTWAAPRQKEQKA